MLDKTSEENLDEAVAIAEAEPSGEMLAIKVTKGETINVDVSRLPDRIYKAVILHGLNKLINRKAKGDKTDVMKPDERAAHNLAAMYANTYKIVGSKASTSDGKASGPVMTEARRLATLAVKAEMKAQKIKVTHIPKTQITALANDLIASNPEFIKQAQASLKAADDAVANKKTSALKFVVDPKLVKAAEDKKAKAKATAGQTLSATQAGKIVAKAKPATK